MDKCYINALLKKMFFQNNELLMLCYFVCFSCSVAAPVERDFWDSLEDKAVSKQDKLPTKVQ